MLDMADITTSDVDGLIASLDPDRNYGERTYEQVVAEVRAGALNLSPGRFGIPRITDAQTNRAVAGTGQPPVAEGSSPRDWGNARFRQLAAEHFETAWGQLVQGMHPDHKSADKFHKIFWETFLGKPGESRSQLLDKVAETLLAAAASSSSSTLTAEDITDAEFREA